MDGREMDDCRTVVPIVLGRCTGPHGESVADGAQA